MVAVGAGTTAVTVVAAGAGMAAAPVSLGLEPPVGGGEDCLTLGRKLSPPCLFTIVGLEKERRCR